MSDLGKTVETFLRPEKQDNFPNSLDKHVPNPLNDKLEEKQHNQTCRILFLQPISIQVASLPVEWISWSVLSSGTCLKSCSENVYSFILRIENIRAPSYNGASTT